MLRMHHIAEDSSDSEAVVVGGRVREKGPENLVEPRR